MARSELFSDTLNADNTTEAAFTPAPEATDAPLAEVTANEAPLAADPEVTEDSDTDKAAADSVNQASVDAFIATATTAVEQSDPTTSTISEADLDHVSNAYRLVTGGAKFKTLAKNFIKDQMIASLQTPSDASVETKTAAFAQAKAWSEVQQHIQLPAAKAPAKEPKAPKVKANPAQDYADKVTSLQVALSLMEDNLPEGVTEDWADEEGVTIADELEVGAEAQTLYAWTIDTDEDKGEAPEVSVLARNAVAVALGKGVGAKRKARTGGASVSTYTGPRRNVAAHIESAFSDVPSGTFLTVSEIVAHESSEYGAGEVSAGAVSARLFPSTGKATTIAGVTPGENDKGVNGAAKI